MDRRWLRWRSGPLVGSPLSDNWALTREVRDPAIPNLPLETPAAAPAGGFFSPLLFIIGGLGAATSPPASGELPPLTMPPMQALGWGSGNWGWR